MCVSMHVCISQIGSSREIRWSEDNFPQKKVTSRQI